MADRSVGVGAVVFYDDKVLLVRNTYGAAKGKYVIPGGGMELDEMPETALERELLEETNIIVKAQEIIAIRFTSKEVWCIFKATYVSGEPTSDNAENDSATFMDINEALVSDEVIQTSKALIKSALDNKKNVLGKSGFVNPRFSKDKWQLYI